MTLVQVNVPDPQTQPDGLPRTAVIGEWRPERAVTDRVFALAAQLDHRDPLFDDIGSIMATGLLMAGAELDIIEKRRSAVTGTPFRTVALRGEFRPQYASATCFECGWATHFDDPEPARPRGEKHAEDTGHEVVHLDLAERAQSRGPQ